MKAEAIRVAEIKAQADNLRELLHNPVVEIVAAYVIIELLQRCLAAVGMQQLAPLAPAIAQGTESIAKVIPGLLALGMGA
jgi:hypothetical protein